MSTISSSLMMTTMSFSPFLMPDHVLPALDFGSEYFCLSGGSSSSSSKTALARQSLLR